MMRKTKKASNRAKSDRDELNKLSSHFHPSSYSYSNSHGGDSASLNDERYLRHIERRVTGEVGGEIEASAQRKRKNQKWGKVRLQTSLAYRWCSVMAGGVNFIFFSMSQQ